MYEVLSFDPVAVRELVERSAADVSVGGPELAGHALRAGLVGEVRLFVSPVVVGEVRLFVSPVVVGEVRLFVSPVVVGEVRLFVSPVVVGGGTSAWPADLDLGLELLDERRFAHGAVHLRYRVTT